MSGNLCGSQARAAKRNFEPEAFSRKEAEILLTRLVDVDIIKKFETAHKNKHVRRRATARIESLFAAPIQDSIQDPVQEAIAMSAREPSEFDLLVERFKAEGKLDPIKSAKASMLAKAGAAKRKAQQQLNS